MSNLLVSAGSYGKRALGTAREGFAHLRERLRGPRPAQPADDGAVDGDCAEVKDHLSERSISSQLLRISLVALLLKVLHSTVDRKWVSAASSSINLFYSPSLIWTMWDTLLEAIVPFLCGAAMLVVTWYTVFLDRCIPGVYPIPTEPKTKKLFSWPTHFHIGHTIGLINGLLLLFLVYFGYKNTPL